jgi:hypothetical protein
MRFTREPLLALALGLAVALPLAVPAMAQTTSGYPASCEASKVSKADVDRAHTVYLSGKGFLDESNYDKAISYFKDAYSIDCSVHGILPIIATAYERKGDKPSAVQALQEYLKRVPNASDREVVERRIKNLQDQIGPAAPATVPVPPASAAPTTSTPPTPSTTAPPATVAPSATTAPTVPNTPPPNDERGHSVAPWVIVGVGGAAVIAGVVLYGVGSGKVSNAEGVCGSSHTDCPTDPVTHQITPAGQSAISDGNNGRTLETVGVVVGAVGLGGVAAGLLWHFLEPTSTSTGGTGTVVSPAVAPGYAGLSVGGQF